MSRQLEGTRPPSGRHEEINEGKACVGAAAAAAQSRVARHVGMQAEGQSVGQLGRRQSKLTRSQLLLMLKLQRKPEGLSLKHQYKNPLQVVLRNFLKDGTQAL